jgi:L-seryl-tRNA(Ser) seleniumtransferase
VKGGRPALDAADVYARLGVRTYINAAGNVTDFGASIPDERTQEAMRAAVRSYVDLKDLRPAVDRRIAELTRNDAALVTLSASAALHLAVLGAASAHVGTRGDVPTIEALRNLHVLVPARCRTPYDIAARQTGVRLVDCDESRIADAVTESTVAVLYAPEAADPVGGEDARPVIEQAHGQGVPVIVDAAARIPPASTLWDYTAAGADAVIFSGGKAIAGPQSTGLVVGTDAFLSWMRPLLFPAEGPGRMFKVGRDEMVGLLVAIECLVERDEAAYRERCEQVVHRLSGAFIADPRVVVTREYPNAAGQSVPYAGFRLVGAALTAAEVARRLKQGDPAVLVGAVPWGSKFTAGFLVNPMTLRDEEVDPVVEAIRAALAAPGPAN